MRKRDGWMVAMVAIVAVGTTAAQRNDNTAVLKGAAAFGDWRGDKPGSLIVPEDGNGTIWRVSYRERGSVKP